MTAPRKGREAAAEIGDEGRYTSMKETSARLCRDARDILVHTAGRNGETKASVVNHVIKRLDERVKTAPAQFVRRRDQAGGMLGLVAA